VKESEIRAEDSGDRMLGISDVGVANAILHDTRYERLPGMATTLDLKLTSRRESCSEPPYWATEAMLADSRSATAKMIANNLPCLGFASWPNVKDEPRWELARRVQHYDSLSLASFRNSFDRTRRDRSRRWLWRLVGLVVGSESALHITLALHGFVRWVGARMKPIS
jgi:hypothetical protein